MATSIFTAQTPSITNGDDGTDYTLGTAFRRSASGSITHGRWYFPDPVPAGTTEFILYDVDTQAELARASFVSPAANAWNTVELASPVAYTANTLLVAAVYTSARYVATANFFTADLVNGDITAPGATNGRLGNTDEYPSTVSGNDACFFADVVFAGGTAYNQSLSGAIAPAATVARQTSKSPTGALSPAGALARQAGKVLVGAVTPSAALTRQVGKALTGALAPSGVLARQTAKALTGTLTPSGAVLKLLSRLLGGSVAPAGTVSNTTVQLRDLRLDVATPEVAWRTGAPGPTWSTSTPESKWHTGDPTT
jgi:hypothetical protein